MNSQKQIENESKGEVLSSPSERMTHQTNDYLERRLQYARKANLNKFRINWETKILRELRTLGINATFCSHVFEKMNNEENVSLRVYVKKDGKKRKYRFPLGEAADIESLKNEDYRGILNKLIDENR